MKHFLGWIELGNCEIIQEIYFEFIMILRRDEKTIKRTLSNPFFSTSSVKWNEIISTQIYYVSRVESEMKGRDYVIISQLYLHLKFIYCMLGIFWFVKSLRINESPWT